MPKSQTKDAKKPKKPTEARKTRKNPNKKKKKHTFLTPGSWRPWIQAISIIGSKSDMENDPSVLRRYPLVFPKHSNRISYIFKFGPWIPASYVRLPECKSSSCSGNFPWKTLRVPPSVVTRSGDSSFQCNNQWMPAGLITSYPLTNLNMFFPHLTS